MEMNKEFEGWFNSRPKVIQEMIKKWPPSEYLIKEDAPYGISCGGTKVVLYSYREDGDVNVVVPAENKLPSAIEHENYLGLIHNKTQDELKDIIHSDVMVKIDPIWLEKIDSDGK